MSNPDQRIAEFCEKADFGAATTALLETHGGEIFQFLLSRSREAQVASDAFAVFAEDVLLGLPRFGFRSSIRTWVYTLAYHALARTKRTLSRQRSREVLQSEVVAAIQKATSERSETPPYLRTDIKQRLLALRERLPEADAILVEMRVTHRFSWKDIARVFIGPDHQDDARLIDKEAARLRKRFQLVSANLREMAKAEGLLGSD